MFAVGHLALGYLLGRVSSKLLAVDVNISYLFFFSALPDIDLLIQRFGLEHRGPSHSVVLSCMFFFPIFLRFRKKAFPLFVALIQHSLIGDLFTGGGSQLLWPLNLNWFKIASMNVASMANIVLEWVAFLGSMILLFKFKDVWFFVKPHNSNLALLIPLAPISFTLLAFTVSVFGFQRVTYGFRVPTALIIPHVAFFLLFTIAILVDLGLGAKVLARRIAAYRI